MISLETQLTFMRHQLGPRRFTYSPKDVEVLEAVVKTIEKAKWLREAGDEILQQRDVLHCSVTPKPMKQQRVN